MLTQNPFEDTVLHNKKSRQVSPSAFSCTFNNIYFKALISYGV